MYRLRFLLIAAACAALTLIGAGGVTAQKYGGILKSTQRANPPSLSPHDEATFVTSWPMSAVYDNLLQFDPLEAVESMDTVRAHLAESWAWDSSHTKLTFKLHRGVKWHDGKPFTAKDVKHTFDVVRGASKQRLKLNPRKLWYKNVKDITTSGDHEVTFVLTRPQPSLVPMLASNYSPVYPAHVNPKQVRTQAMGTGPFKLAEYKRDIILKTVKNPDYWRKGRPYLDGVTFVVIRKKATRTAAMVAGQVDVGEPTETDQQVYEQLKDHPGLAFNRAYPHSNVNFLINANKPPFDNPKLRTAVNMAMDRYSYTRSAQPGYLVGGFQPPVPQGTWGIPLAELKQIPGYRDPQVDKDAARKLMRELGYGPDKRFKVKVSTRSTANYVSGATWAVGELQKIYMDAELEVVETGNWHAKVARRDYSLALNATGAGIDDPDVPFFESFSCGSQRNYNDYCKPEMQKLFDKQSAMVDQKARYKLAQEIERMLVEDVARISLGFRINYNVRYKYVKNFVGHNTNYNWPAWDEIWLDK